MRAIAERLTNLTTLDLRNNQIGDAGVRAIAERLTNLTKLDLGNNLIGEAGARAIAERLTNLTELRLWDNQIGEAGARAIAERLTNLTTLDIWNNQIGDAGTRAIAERLTNLTTLNIAKNAVTSLDMFADRILSGWQVIWKKYSGAPSLNVYECPLQSPTVEIASQGPEAVLNYYRELEAQGSDQLYEAKVLILGEGGSGKTSLLRRLYQPELPLPEEKDTTRGIDVHHHDFPCKAGRNLRLNVWDFGGQQIYHATHQFFLTRNSLYILVDDTKRDDKTVHDDGFKFWLQVVETLSESSPLLIFQNEKGGRSKAIDEDGIRANFPNYKEKFAGNLEDPASVAKLRAAIEYHVQQLPHIGQTVPKMWVTIRAAIEEVARDNPYITQHAYFDIYARYLPFDRTKALHLSQYFHDIGVFLHFQTDRQLAKTVILQNPWATEAVFKVLDNEAIKSRFGRFNLADCEQLWADSKYADMHVELRGLMEKFELCYELPARGEWIAPQLLSPSKPQALHGWGEPTDLVLRYKYTFRPRGLVSRLMVRQHRYVKQLDKCWAHGAFFEHDTTQILVEETVSGAEIEFRARGPEAKVLLSVLSQDLEALNATFKGLDGKVEKQVPCICKECRTKTVPEMYPYENLVKRRQDGKQTIECRTSYEDVGVLEILDGYRVDQKPAWADVLPDVDKDTHGMQATVIASGVQHNPLPAALTESRRQAAKRQVCAIFSNQKFIGTGVLVGEKRILTNKHVYDQALAADSTRTSWVAVFDVFDEKQNLSELTMCAIVVPTPLISSEPKELDYAFLELKSVPKGNRGYLQASQKRSVETGLPMHVLTYRGKSTAGKAKPLPLEERSGTMQDHNSHARRMAYSAITSPGSSGSPVFNEEYLWIGLHHHGEEKSGNHGIPLWAIGEDLKTKGQAALLTFLE